MYTPRAHQRRGDAGYAMMTVVIFMLVVTIAGIAFFAMAGHESEGALYRQASSEAFLLADGAVERIRAKFLEDRTWRTGFANETAGRGTYDATVVDTVYGTYDNAVHIVATGRVENAVRKIDVVADVPPTGFGLGVLIMGDADVSGNFCLEGDVHVNGDGDFGPNDAHLACGGEMTDGFEITPPMMYTDPDHFPNTTYYYVRGFNDGAGNYSARIYDRWGVDITATKPDSLQDVTTYNAGQKTFTYDFNSAAKVDKYFDELTGIFSKDPGDVSVVVNFGESAAVDPPGVDAFLMIRRPPRSTLVPYTTLINTRFTGTTMDQRIDETFWTGGLTTLKQIQMEPTYGIGLIAHNFQKVGGSNTYVGSETWPAFMYVTQNVVGVNANFILTGSIITLGDWYSSGGPDLEFDDGFLQNFPDWLVEDWNSGVSGTLKVLRWRELAAGN